MCGYCCEVDSWLVRSFLLDGRLVLRTRENSAKYERKRTASNSCGLGGEASLVKLFARFRSVLKANIKKNYEQKFVSSRYFAFSFDDALHTTSMASNRIYDSRYTENYLQKKQKKKNVARENYCCRISCNHLDGIYRVTLYSNYIKKIDVINEHCINMNKFLWIKYELHLHICILKILLQMLFLTLNSWW